MHTPIGMVVHADDLLTNRHLPPGRVKVGAPGTLRLIASTLDMDEAVQVILFDPEGTLAINPPPTPIVINGMSGFFTVPVNFAPPVGSAAGTLSDLGTLHFMGNKATDLFRAFFFLDPAVGGQNIRLIADVEIVPANGILQSDPLVEDQ